MSQKFPNVVHSIPGLKLVHTSPNFQGYILDHRRSFQTQAPTIDPHVLWQSHRLEHLRSKHATVPYFHPFIQAIMKAEDLHTRLGIRVISRLEAKFMDSHFGEEDLHEPNQATKCKTKVCNDPFYLVKFR